MSNKGNEAAAKKLAQYYSQFPDWYWKFGLHDAKILSVRELEFTPNWKEAHPKRNCLEFLLDSSNALCETDIRKISLYNYRIVSMKSDNGAVVPEAFRNTTWMGDGITKLDSGRYLLEIECLAEHCALLTLAVRFDAAEVERQ